MITKPKKVTTQIVCGKFDNRIDFEDILSSEPKLVRIGSKNPNKLPNVPNYTLISTDGINVLYKGSKFNISNFLSFAKKNELKDLLVLTFKERMLILDRLVDYDTDVKVLENLYPIFNDIKYYGNINKTYDALQDKINLIKNMNLNGKSIANYNSVSNQFRVERKLRFKNTYDKAFAYAYRGGYQEVFKFVEERSDRKIIALDFNSMFADCMKGDFVDPKNIKYIKYDEPINDVGSLYNGLYKVVLIDPIKSFFREMHPFKYTVLNKTFYFDLEKDHSIEVLLFKNEILFYRKYFKEVQVIEGFYSEKSITHPLLGKALSIYNERLKNEGSSIENKLHKLELAMMHSSTNPRKYASKSYKTIEEVYEFLDKYFMLKDHDNISRIEKVKSLKKTKYFSIKRNNGKYKIEHINFENDYALYSLSAQILANSRLKMIKTIEKLLSHKSVEICYANIDSIHVSILSKELDQFLHEFNYLISNKLGGLKIESISNRGYWFDVGRYWLFSEKNLVQFKNVIFSHKGSINCFVKSRCFKIHVKTQALSFVKTIYFNIYNSFNYGKKIKIYSNFDTIDYKRYNFDEISDLVVANKSYCNEMFRSKEIKINIFDKIATV